MPDQSVNQPAANHSRNFTYLALGDSYTIGQSVPAADNYPNQLLGVLKHDSLNGQLKIIATTGWTTDQLQSGIREASQTGTLLPKYDMVTLLIGVNNQYQGQAAAAYGPKFEALLKKSIGLAGNDPRHVIVISIPDWGVTPFASGRNPAQIAREIDAFNDLNYTSAVQYGVNYVNVTELTRMAKSDPSLLAQDNLHYSAKEYALWADQLRPLFIKALQ